MNRENADGQLPDGAPPGAHPGHGSEPSRAARVTEGLVPEPSRAATVPERLVPLAAIGSVLAAASCCLPIFPFVVAAGFAGGSAFLNAARPYLMGASVLFLAFGFYRRRRAKQCRRKPSAIGAALLWVSTVFVIVSILFPQVMANAAADLLAR